VRVDGELYAEIGDSGAEFIETLRHLLEIVGSCTCWTARPHVDLQVAAAKVLNKADQLEVIGDDLILFGGIFKVDLQRVAVGYCDKLDADLVDLFAQGLGLVPVGGEVVDEGLDVAIADFVSFTEGEETSFSQPPRVLLVIPIW